jgi:hypothetical protein
MVASKYDKHVVNELFDDALRRGAKDVERRATIDEIMVSAYGSNEALQRQQDHALERFMEGHRPKFLQELAQGPNVALATSSPREDPLAAFRPDDSAPLAHLNRGRSSQTKDGSGVLCSAGCEVSGWGRSCPRAPDPSQVSVREVVGLSVLSFRRKLGRFKA